MARDNSPFGSPAEFALLESIWQNKNRTIRQLATEHYPGHMASGRATVQKLLKRLECKGLVNRDSSVSPHVISPAQSRLQLAKMELEALAKKYGMKPADMTKM